MSSNSSDESSSSEPERPVTIRRPMIKAPSKQITRIPRPDISESDSDESDSDEESDEQSEPQQSNQFHQPSDSKSQTNLTETSIADSEKDVFVYPQSSITASQFENDSIDSQDTSVIKEDKNSEDESMATSVIQTEVTESIADTNLQNKNDKNSEMDTDSSSDESIKTGVTEQTATSVLQSVADTNNVESNLAGDKEDSFSSSSSSSDESVKSEGSKRVKGDGKDKSGESSGSDSGDASVQVEEKKAAVNKENLFGDSSTDSDGDESSAQVDKKNVDDDMNLFGETNLSSDDDDNQTEETKPDDKQAQKPTGQQSGSDSSSDEDDITRINVEIPKISANLGDEIHFVRLPNFISIQSRPFNPNYYQDENVDEESIMDEEGRARLKLRMENTIRWRNTVDPETGETIKESNSRFIKYSDGSIVLQVGTELFDITAMPITDYNHLFIRQGTGLQGQAVFKHKLSFKPISTKSLTHKKVMNRLQQRAMATVSKVKVMSLGGQKDPDKAGFERAKKSEMELRRMVKLKQEKARKDFQQQNKSKKSGMTQLLTSRDIDMRDRYRTQGLNSSDSETSSSGDESEEDDKNKKRSGSKSSESSDDGEIENPLEDLKSSQKKTALSSSSDSDSSD